MSCLRPSAVWGVGSEGSGATSCHCTPWQQEKQEAQENSERATASAPPLGMGPGLRLRELIIGPEATLEARPWKAGPSSSGPSVGALVPLSRMPHPFCTLKNSKQDAKTSVVTYYEGFSGLPHGWRASSQQSGQSQRLPGLVSTFVTSPSSFESFKSPDCPPGDSCET